jgi:hypothetical protein
MQEMPSIPRLPHQCQSLPVPDMRLSVVSPVKRDIAEVYERESHAGTTSRLLLLEEALLPQIHGTLPVAKTGNRTRELAERQGGPGGIT